MPRRCAPNILAPVGGIALLSAIVWSAVGLALYGSQMTPDLLAELAGVSFEVAVAALIVERVMSRRQRREWDFAYRTRLENTRPVQTCGAEARVVSQQASRPSPRR
ncbi:hypothetical protein LFM09_40125 [Lentzea alba]|uniref:hypothetical protein n=1 Tax=Lentzea alba TaxID=2714351 RepID=UPI0039BFCF14